MQAEGLREDSLTRSRLWAWRSRCHFRAFRPAINQQSKPSFLSRGARRPGEYLPFQARVQNQVTDF